MSQMDHTKIEIQKIWAEAFNDSADYIDFYFSRVYNPAHALTLNLDDSIVSSLLLQPYKFIYNNAELPMSYVAGAATRRQFRGRGFMTTLMREAIEKAASSESALVCLIPASEWLYYYYAKFGFATVFFTNPRRYTSLHRFVNNGLIQVTQPYNDSVFDAFHHFELSRGAGVVHSLADFKNILSDLEFDNGYCAIAANSSGEIKGMAFSVVNDDEEIVVKEIFGESEADMEAALYFTQSHYGEKPIVVNFHPGQRRMGATEARGMARIVDPTPFLKAAASKIGKRHIVIRLHDSLIAENNQTFILSHGDVKTSPEHDANGRFDFDIDIETLALILFSSRTIGEIIDFPSERATLNLMLD